MPKKLISRIEKEYKAKGKSSKEAERIAYATVNKQGLLKDRKKRKTAKKR